jgi:hypothetical protein
MQIKEFEMVLSNIDRIKNWKEHLIHIFKFIEYIIKGKHLLFNKLTI